MEDHESAVTEESQVETLPTHDFRVVAVGRAGIAAMDLLCGDTALAGVDLIALHTDGGVVGRSRAPFRHCLNSGQPRGLGAGGDPSLGQAAAEREAASIRKWVQGARMVFVLTGLGAGTGTGAAPVVARIARECGALVLGVATLPFHCEGRLRSGHAQSGLQSLKAAADAVITVPNQRVLSMLDRNTTAMEVFATANRLLVDGIRGLWQLLTRPGLIQLDFATLERMLRGRHSESVFASVSASGDHRAREVVERLLASPFLSPDPVLASADAVLVAVTAGPDVPFAEIEQVLAHIQRQADQAQVVTGTSVDPALAGGLMVTLVASIGGSAPLPEAVPRFDTAATSMPMEADRRTDAERSVGDVLGLGSPGGGRSSGGLVPPAPELTAEQRDSLGGRATGRLGTRKKKVVQSMFNFDVVSRGRFEKTEATVMHGQDLDVPTFLRRGIALN
jgi:cell division protein FtsZ